MARPRSKEPSRRSGRRIIPVQGISIVLDTNCFVGGTIGPNSPGFSNLASLADFLGCRVVVPEVVLREWIRQAKQRLTEWATQAERTISSYAGILGKPAPRTPLFRHVATHTDGLEGLFRRELEKQNVVIAPLPPASVEDLLNRDLQGARPFRDGHGFRDTLIWYSVLDEARLGQAVKFVTNNSKDFGSQAALLPNLEAEAKALTDGSVALLPTLGAAIDWLTSTYLKPVDNKIGKQADEAFGEDLSQILTWRVESEIGRRPNADWLLSLPSGYPIHKTIRVNLGPVEQAAKLDEATFATIPFEALLLSSVRRGVRREPILLHLEAKMQCLLTKSVAEVLGFIPGAIPKFTTGEEAQRAWRELEEELQDLQADMAMYAAREDQLS